MADIGEHLGPVIEPLLQPGERLEGMCIGSQSGLLRGSMVAIAATDRRLIVQVTDRRMRPKGEPTSVAAGEVASSSTGGAGGLGGDPQSAIMNRTSLTLRVRTRSGEKLRLMVASGPGPLRGLTGGTTQEEGVRAVTAWLQRNTPG